MNQDNFLIHPSSFILPTSEDPREELAMRPIADRVRMVGGRADRRPVGEAEMPVTPERVRLKRKLERGEKYRKTDRRCDAVAQIKLHEGVQDILSWLRTA